jgi:RNA polymerase sigma-70 factor, ECF subfamily
VSETQALAPDDTLGEWVRQRYRTAYRTAVLICGLPADAEEAVQDAFLRAWRFRDALPDGERRDAWFYRVLVNACYSKMRREGPRRTREGAPLEDTTPNDDRDAPDALAERSLAATALQEALQTLPEALRVVLVLRYYADLSERDIAIAIRRRPGTVKSRLHEARRRLATDARLAAYRPNAEVSAP